MFTTQVIIYAHTKTLVTRIAQRLAVLQKITAHLLSFEWSPLVIASTDLPLPWLQLM